MISGYVCLAIKIDQGLNLSFRGHLQEDICVQWRTRISGHPGYGDYCKNTQFLDSYYLIKFHYIKFVQRCLHRSYNFRPDATAVYPDSELANSPIRGSTEKRCRYRRSGLWPIRVSVFILFWYLAFGTNWRPQKNINLFLTQVFISNTGPIRDTGIIAVGVYIPIKYS